METQKKPLRVIVLMATPSGDRKAKEAPSGDRDAKEAPPGDSADGHPSGDRKEKEAPSGDKVDGTPSGDRKAKEATETQKPKNSRNDSILLQSFSLKNSKNSVFTTKYHHFEHVSEH